MTTIVSSYQNGNDIVGGSLTDAPGIAGVTASTGDIIYLAHHYRNQDSRTITGVAWNSQNFEQLVAPFGPNNETHSALYRLVVAAGGTAAIVGATSDAGFLRVLSTAVVVSGPFAEAPNTEPVTATRWAASGYSNPDFSAESVLAGDTVLAWVSGPLWNESYDTLTFTWDPAGAEVEQYMASALAAVGQHLVASATGAGTVNFGFTPETDPPSTVRPGWGSMMLVVKALAETPAIIDVNGDDVVVIGPAVNTLTVEFLVVTFASVGGIPVAVTEIASGETYTFPLSFIDQQALPQIGTVNVLAATGEDPEAPDYKSATLPVDLQLPAGFAAVLYSVLSDDSTSLAAQIEGGIIEPGDRHYYPAADITIYDNSEYSDAITGTVETWLHKPADHPTMPNVLIQVLIINGYPVVPSSQWRPIEFIEGIDFIG